MKLKELFLFESLPQRRDDERAYLRKLSSALLKIADDCPLCGYVFMGTYLGYPPDSIKHFLKRSIKINDMMNKGYTDDEIISALPFKGGAFDGTGFLPSPRDRKKKPENLVRTINKNRFYKNPFVLEPDNNEDDDIMISVVRELKRNKAFNEKCLENLRKIAPSIPEININIDQYIQRE